MLQPTIRQIPWILALFVLGPLAGSLTGALRAPDGSGDASLLLGIQPLAGVGAGVVSLLLALVAGLVASRINGPRSGFNCAGIVLAWAAWRTTTIDAIIARTHDASSLYILAGEGLAFGLGAWLVAMVVHHAGLGRGAHAALHPMPPGGKPLGAWLRAPLRANKDRARANESFFASILASFVPATSLIIVGVTVAVGIGVAYLAAQDPLKGQSIFAAALALIVAVPLARLLALRGSDAPPEGDEGSFMLGAAVLAMAGPIAGVVIHGRGLVDATYTSDLFGAASPVSIDWAAGAMLGIPIGDSWFRSMFAHRPAGAAEAS